MLKQDLRMREIERLQGKAYFWDTRNTSADLDTSRVVKINLKGLQIELTFESTVAVFATVNCNKIETTHFHNSLVSPMTYVVHEGTIQLDLYFYRIKMLLPSVKSRVLYTLPGTNFILTCSYISTTVAISYKI